MTWYNKANIKKLYIMRGLPGSGKSTKAQELGQSGVIYGSDEYFMKDGEYIFDQDKLKDAHKWNLDRVIEAMGKGTSPIVADNTNVSNHDMKPYVESALENGYEIEFVEADTPWKFDVKELTKRNTHEVPADAIQGMLDRWDYKPTIPEILESERPEEKESNNNSQIKIATMRDMEIAQVARRNNGYIRIIHNNEAHVGRAGDVRNGYLPIFLPNGSPMAFPINEIEFGDIVDINNVNIGDTVDYGGNGYGY